MAIVMQAKNMREIEATMAGFMERMKNPSAFLKSAGALMLESVQRNFIEGGRPERWKPVSDVTYYLRYKYKARFKTALDGTLKRLTKKSADNFVSGGAEPLRDTGVLMTSIAPKETTNNSISIGTNQPQAELLHSGGIAKGFMHGTAIVPARPFLIIQDADKENLGKILKEFVMRGAQ